MADVNPKRLCPGCVARQLAMNAEPCAICGRVNLVTAPRPREKMNAFARFVRRMLKPLGWFTQTLTFIAFVWAIWAMALHWITPFFASLCFGLLCLALGFIWTTRFFTRAAVWLFSPDSRRIGIRRRDVRSFLVLPLCVVLAALLNRFDVPLRVAFRLSEAALEQEVRAMPMFSTGRGWKPFLPAKRAGLYRVKRADVSGKNVRIEVTDNVFLSGTRAGFAYCPQGCQSANFPPAFVDHSAAPTYIALSKNWNWWEESGDDF